MVSERMAPQGRNPLTINPKYLRAFLTVARTGSVIRASEEVHRAQSAVTRSIKELEAGLNAPLFERRAYGMLLTEFGRVLLERVEVAFAEMQAARSGFRTQCPQGRWNDNAPVFSLSLSRQRLLVFVDLIEQRHMGAVADAFGISQPAVSQVLREVEQGLGVTLVSRTPTGILPNGLGLMLSMHVRRALAELRKAEAEVASLQSGVSGQVVVGTLSLGRNRLLPRAIIALTETYPNLKVSTVEGTFEHLAVLLRAGDIDFVLGGLRPPEHMVGLSSEVVVEDMLGVIVRRGHPLTAHAAIDFPDLEDARWVLPQRGTSTRTALEVSLSERRLPAPSVIVETADIAITRGLLIGSEFLTAASPHLFQHEIDAGELEVLPLPLPASRRGIGIVQRSDSKPSIAARLLMDGIRQIHLL